MAVAAPGSLTLAAQYLRMSREHQRYSPGNQANAIASYAAERGFEIVRTYRDDGRSGLSLSGREGLKHLLSDALAEARPFSAVLVLDVSRWGRFQDPDQAAHYEFMCREAGVAVHYCGEPFENDSSSAATILKHLKRVMAGEFSRELGEKVFAGQSNAVRLGYKQGGVAPFATRRLLINEAGQPVRVLEEGQRKSLQTDRVVLVWGPDCERQTVRDIFQWFVTDALAFKVIVARLAKEGLGFPDGAAITRTQVGKILRNELYRGVYTYNKTTQRLHRGLRRNSPHEWVRVQMLEPLVSESTFASAQKRLAERHRHPTYTDAYLLNHLRRLIAANGTFHSRDLDQVSGPTAATYYNRFGSLHEALRLAGWDRLWLRRQRTPPATNPELIRSLQALLRQAGYLSHELIRTTPDLPSPSVFQRRFGSLSTAYELAGWTGDASELRIRANARRWKRRKMEDGALHHGF